MEDQTPSMSIRAGVLSISAERLHGMKRDEKCCVGEGFSTLIKRVGQQRRSLLSGPDVGRIDVSVSQDFRKAPCFKPGDDIEGWQSGWCYLA